MFATLTAVFRRTESAEDIVTGILKTTDSRTTNDSRNKLPALSIPTEKSRTTEEMTTVTSLKILLSLAIEKK